MYYNGGVVSVGKYRCLREFFTRNPLGFIQKNHGNERAGVVELADTSDLGSDAERLGGSNPLARSETTENSRSDHVLRSCTMFTILRSQFRRIRH